MTENSLPLRIAQIGAGAWSRYAHGPALQRFAKESSVSLELICDLNLERALAFRDQFGYRETAENIFEGLEKATPDAIICTVQPAATAELVHSLLPLRIPLFIEKPPGTSLIEATSLAEASAAAGTFTFVAFNRRNIPSIRILKQWTAENTVRFARAEMLRNNRLEPHFAIETGIHALDTMRFLMGNPESIEVRTHPHESSLACDCVVRFNYHGTAAAEISLMLNCGMRRESYFLTGDGTAAVATLGPPYSSDLIAQGGQQWQDEKIVGEVPITNDPLVDCGFMGQYENFFQSLREGTPSTCTLRDAAYSMQIADAVHNRYSGPLPRLFSD